MPSKPFSSLRQSSNDWSANIKKVIHNDRTLGSEHFHIPQGTSLSLISLNLSRHFAGGYESERVSPDISPMTKPHFSLSIVIASDLILVLIQSSFANSMLDLPFMFFKHILYVSSLWQQGSRIVHPVFLSKTLGSQAEANP